MRRKRVYLLTGATGFIGASLLRRLVHDNEKVNIIVRKEANLWRIRDILDKTTCHTSDLSDLVELKRIFNNRIFVI